MSILGLLYWAWGRPGPGATELRSFFKSGWLVAAATDAKTLGLVTEEEALLLSNGESYRAKGAHLVEQRGAHLAAIVGGTSGWSAPVNLPVLVAPSLPNGTRWFASGDNLIVVGTHGAWVIAKKGSISVHHSLQEGILVASARAGEHKVGVPCGSNVTSTTVGALCEISDSGELSKTPLPEGAGYFEYRPDGGILVGDGENVELRRGAQVVWRRELQLAFRMQATRRNVLLLGPSGLMGLDPNSGVTVFELAHVTRFAGFGDCVAYQRHGADEWVRLKNLRTGTDERVILPSLSYNLESGWSRFAEVFLVGQYVVVEEGEVVHVARHVTDCGSEP